VPDKKFSPNFCGISFWKMATKNRRYVNSDKKGLTTVMYILVHDDEDNNEDADSVNNSDNIALITRL
jgi:hypothetical protein